MHLAETRSTASEALTRCSIDASAKTGARFEIKITRRTWIAACLAAATGCGRAPRPLEQLFPRSIAGSRLVRVERLPLDRLSADLQRFKVRQAARAAYEGQQPVRVALYEMANPKTAYAMLRMTHESAGAAAFYHGDYFGVVEAPGAGRDKLDSLSQAIAADLARE